MLKSCSFQAHTYVDSREKVTARYQVNLTPSSHGFTFVVQVVTIMHLIICPFSLINNQLICPSKREVKVFGKQAGTLLPKAPKGWGWRSAILFDELPYLLQNGCLRVSAVVQLV